MLGLGFTLPECLLSEIALRDKIIILEKFSIQHLHRGADFFSVQSSGFRLWANVCYNKLGLDLIYSQFASCLV